MTFRLAPMSPSILVLTVVLLAPWLITPDQPDAFVRAMAARG